MTIVEMVLLFPNVKNFGSLVQSEKFKQNVNIGKNLDLNFQPHFGLVFRVDKAFQEEKVCPGIMKSATLQAICLQKFL